MTEFSIFGELSLKFEIGWFTPTGKVAKSVQTGSMSVSTVSVGNFTCTSDLILCTICVCL